MEGDDARDVEADLAGLDALRAEALAMQAVNGELTVLEIADGGARNGELTDVERGAARDEARRRTEDVDVDDVAGVVGDSIRFPADLERRRREGDVHVRDVAWRRDVDAEAFCHVGSAARVELESGGGRERLGGARGVEDPGDDAGRIGHGAREEDGAPARIHERRTRRTRRGRAGRAVDGEHPDVEEVDAARLERGLGLGTEAGAGACADGGQIAVEARGAGDAKRLLVDAALADAHEAGNHGVTADGVSGTDGAFDDDHGRRGARDRLRVGTIVRRRDAPDGRQGGEGACQEQVRPHEHR
jgi:hypothetical protein